jgi:hypothetical protein
LRYRSRGNRNLRIEPITGAISRSATNKDPNSQIRLDGSKDKSRQEAINFEIAAGSSVVEERTPPLLGLAMRECCEAPPRRTFRQVRST